MWCINRALLVLSISAYNETVFQLAEQVKGDIVPSNQVQTHLAMSQN